MVSDDALIYSFNLDLRDPEKICASCSSVSIQKRSTSLYKDHLEMLMQNILPNVSCLPFALDH